MIETVGIVGLGLIGGSMAKTVRETTTCRIYACNRSKNIVEQAIAEDVIHGELNADTLKECDLLILNLYARRNIEYVKENISFIKKGAVLVDSTGIKGSVCRELSDFCEENGVHFIGGHPMAGIEKSGYQYSFFGLFNNATMILCKDHNTDEALFEETKAFFLKLGFGKIRVTTAAEHDAVIAYTSQMAHLVSSAYIKSPTCEKRYGFSAGSFKDLTRVAYLNEDMWTELFAENREHLLEELDVFIKNVQDYRDVLAAENYDSLHKMLAEGRICKENDNRREEEYKAENNSSVCG